MDLLTSVLKRLDELLNTDPANEEALKALFPVEDDELPAFRHWLKTVQIAASALVGSIDADVPPVKHYRGTPAGHKHAVALTWLDQVEAWALGRHAAEHGWIWECHSALELLLKANIAAIKANGEGRRFEARRCLWCDRLFVVELGKRGRPREYCRPSHRVRATEEREEERIRKGGL